MDEDGITLSISRDAAHYLSMLIDDKILSITGCPATYQLEEMLAAYEHAKERLDQALKECAAIAAAEPQLEAMSAA